jgi:DNA-binding MarR family transcriptional regulator
MLNALTFSQGAVADRVSAGSAVPVRAKQVYFALLNERGDGNGQLDELARGASRAFLSRQLELAENLPCDLPDTVRALPGWSEDNSLQVGRRYREYLDARRAGGERWYFSSKVHALYFLRSVAPTKLVDGAWLYGLLHHWNDARFESLIRIYLEELGEGLPDKNHVVLYRKLLASQGCEHWENLSDEHFTQGAIQLALAHHADQFLPELIGYNLGYEQLPLHLLITAYELDELGIDPYYFTLHVTVDNVGTGHARKSLQAVFDTMPKVADAGLFYRRLVNGYKLNMLGANTESVIESFDLSAEFHSVLRAKAAVGAGLHSDYCRIAGRTVNEWLAEPAQVPAFVDALEQAGWIKRGQHPRDSRFWRLIEGERAQMFGVFDAYERQVIQDWIVGAGDAKENHGRASTLPDRPRQRSFRAEQLIRERAMPDRQEDDGGMVERDNPDADTRLLEQMLGNASSRTEAIELLVGLMSPANHHSAAGLMATRTFARMFG